VRRDGVCVVRAFATKLGEASSTGVKMHLRILYLVDSPTREKGEMEKLVVQLILEAEASGLT
jgi:hypothetical protein